MRVIFARKSFGLLKHLYYSNLYPSNFNTNPTRIIEIKRNCRRNSKHILDLPRAEYHNTLKIMPFKTLRSVFQPCFSNSWIRISTLGHRFPIEFSPSKRPLRIYVTEISPDITPRCHKPFHMYIRDIYIHVCVCTRWWKSRIFQARRNRSNLRSIVKLALSKERSMQFLLAAIVPRVVARCDFDRNSTSRLRTLRIFDLWCLCKWINRAIRRNWT